MNKCEYYRTCEFFDPRKRESEKGGCCMGTRELDRCYCGGDPAKCDFYESKRKEGQKMNTATMWLKAQEDGDWYSCVDILYNKKCGFISKVTLKPWYDEADEEDRGLFDIDCFLKNKWQFYATAEDSPILTKAQAEAKFNIKIIG